MLKLINKQLLTIYYTIYYKINNHLTIYNILQKLLN